MRGLSLYLLITLATAAIGCARFQSHRQPLNYQTVKATPAKNARRAKNKNEQGVQFFQNGELPEAERAFQQSLVADVTYGPAHNNLGALYYSQGDYYRAAWEFDDAARLMPGRGEPLNNLGLIYFRVKKYDEAIAYFQQAHECCATRPEYLGNWIRARIARGDRTSDVRDLLEKLRLIENRPEWDEWAAQQLALGKIDVPFVTDHVGLNDESIYVPSREVAPYQSAPPEPLETIQAYPSDLPAPEKLPTPSIKLEMSPPIIQSQPE